jgi:hypothetical protein
MYAVVTLGSAVGIDVKDMPARAIIYLTEIVPVIREASKALFAFGGLVKDIFVYGEIHDGILWFFRRKRTIAPRSVPLSQNAVFVKWARFRYGRL